jgi:hypothetical protein
MSQPYCGSISLALARKPCSSPGERATRLGYKVLVTAFILLHVTSVLWWNLPSKEFDADVRVARLPTWFVAAEKKLFAWKSRTAATSSLAAMLSAYTLASETWQSWMLFAPNPLVSHNYLTVSAVLEEGAEGPPIYDPVPVYTSYRGAPGKALARFSEGRSALDSFSFDQMLALSLTSKDFTAELEPFARYWADVYTERTGRRPLGVDVLCHEYHVPPAFSGIPARDGELRPWRAGWFRY